MRRLAVVLLVLLAGCSAADTGVERTATLSPVAVPEDADGGLVSEQGVAPAADLLAAHERHLAETPSSHVVSGGMFTTGPDYDYLLTVSRSEHRYRATVREDAQHLVDGALVAERTTTGYYHTGELVLVRTTRADAVSYHVLPAEADPPFETVRAGQLGALLSTADLRVVGVEGTNYRLAAESIVVDHLPTYRGVVTDARVPGFYATATPEGHLTDYRFSYSGTLDGEPVHGWVRLASEPAAGVEPPAWYARTANATGWEPSRGR